MSDGDFVEVDASVDQVAGEATPIPAPQLPEALFSYLHEFHAAFKEVLADIAQVQTAINSQPGSTSVSGDISAIKAQVEANGAALTALSAAVSLLSGSVGNDLNP